MEPQKPRKGNDNSELLRNAASLSGVAIQMGVTIFLGNLLGEWLDEKFEKTFLEDTFTLLAVFLSIYLVIKKVMALNK
ncbi:AtpZ/AtpI family protein [Maribacter litoralis]|uniref:Putative F0F1-ATPase subunit Ca2+/Mg2+ transporter n=1 Tax=Maribacter litoralis TaxID=2059726 RepID=A0A653R9W2_9FLAO|nr:AtpZ/AtpI family protein [Maribacter litoralis]VXB51691.1 putative F0F1-ATPase subunit Ca2+/Mg2+ transporter [Maribacter litoralis]|tara:strand:- start:1669 stop:1902 length:234 start_codon:yes stop_codon:yes gene_type:complete